MDRYLQLKLFDGSIAYKSTNTSVDRSEKNILMTLLFQARIDLHVKEKEAIEERADGFLRFLF